MSEGILVKKKYFWSLFWRSFSIQALWNFEGLQNVGFVYGLMPLLKSLYPDPEKRKEALVRHIGFFNTHPYMVNLIYGLVACIEEEIRDNKPEKAREVVMLKNSIAGPLAAIGDTFFWGTWRPFAALMGISCVIISFSRDTIILPWLAPVVFLVVYNSVHLLFRYWTLRISYQLKSRIVEIIANFEFKYVLDLVRFIGFVALAAVLVYYVWAFGKGFSERMSLLGVFAVSVIAGYMRFSPVVMFYSLIFLSVGISLIRG